jgi:5-formyltetrahydrofolate cyclo-ligase
LPSRFSRTRQIPALPDRIRHRWAHAMHRTALSASEVPRIANVAGPVPPNPEVVAEAAANAAAAFGSDGTGRLITRMLAL